MRSAPIIGILLATSIALPVHPAADPLEAAITVLGRAIVPRRDGSHLPLLVGLRQLRDPTLRPLFERLRGVDDWQVQVHAVLGLAELEPQHGVDVALIQGIDPRGQEHVVAQALDQGLLGDEQCRALLAWDGLSTMANLLLVAEVVAKGEPIRRELILALSVHEDLRVAGLATALLRHLEKTRSLEEYRSRLEGLPPGQRQGTLLWLAGAIRQYRLSGALDVVSGEAEAPGATDALVDEAVLAMLELDLEHGLERWSRLLAADRSHSQRVRYGLLLLSAETRIPAEPYREIPDGEPPTDAIASAGTVLARGDDPTTALMRLMESGHPASARSVMHRAGTLPANQAAAVYMHVLDAAPAEPAGQHLELAVQAVSRLFAIEPEAVLERLASAPDDSQLQQIILLGLFEAGRSDLIAPAVAALPRIGPGRADSMTLLLLAKHAPQLSPGDTLQLGTIAAGGGRVGEGLQAQAAWLYLRHSGRTDQALERLLRTVH